MMKDPEFCFACGAGLTRDDIGMYRKAVNRSAEECLCLDCLAKKYNTTRAFFEEKIEMLKSRGCSLFF